MIYFLTLCIITLTAHRSVQFFTDIILIHKKKSKTDIENYRPVSIFPVLSKIYERCMFHQIYSYFDQIPSKHQCGFRHGHSTHHSVLLMVEKLKKGLDNSGACAICKIAKLAAYGLDQPSLCFIYSYFSDRIQRTKVNNTYDSYTNTKYGVPQGLYNRPSSF